jgi:hypothetical protein
MAACMTPALPIPKPSTESIIRAIRREEPSTELSVLRLPGRCFTESHFVL